MKSSELAPETREIPGISAPPAPRGRTLLKAGGLAVLAGAAAAAVACLPLPAALALVGGAVGGILWYLWPDVTPYALALLVPWQLTYSVAGVDDVRLQDALIVVMGIFFVASLLGRSPRVERFRGSWVKLLIGVWAFMMIWGSITYLLGPLNQDLLQGPAKSIWYLYRSVWRELLVFPLVLMGLRDPKAGGRLMDVLILTSAGTALYAIVLSWQTHSEAAGPFSSKNGLAGYLVLVIPFVVARLLLEKGAWTQFLHALLAIVMIRALFLTSSRGGFAAFLVSLTPLVFVVSSRRLVTVGVAAFLVLSAVVIAKGDILDRPNVRRYLSLSRSTEDKNFAWRQEQWKLFIQRIGERPLLGSGSDTDESLVAQGRLATAHNGFLGMAFKAGIPASAAWMGFLLYLLLTAFRRSHGLSEDPEGRAFWVGLTGLILAWMVHNLVDNTLLMAECERLFWMVLAVVALKSGFQRAGSFSPGAPPPSRSTA